MIFELEREVVMFVSFEILEVCVGKVLDVVLRV